MPDAEAAAALLAQKALEAGIARFVDPEALEEFLARVAFAGLQAPDISLVLEEICYGLEKFSRIKERGGKVYPCAGGETWYPRTERSGAGSLAARRVDVRLRVHYEPGKPPWIASRLQDFFGMRVTPRIGAERTPVVVHLLAPNKRAVQTTTDLAGFWERLYPQVRRELMRRYPRHSWPERP